jgi:5-methylcytosine-specific restriction endonuclease McrA
VTAVAGEVNARRTKRQKRQAAELRARHDPCWLCGQPIDYTLPADHDWAFSVDHIKPWSTHPELREDPGNLAAAHSLCNKRRGNKPPPLGLGLLSRNW